MLDRMFTEDPIKILQRAGVPQLDTRLNVLCASDSIADIKSNLFVWGFRGMGIDQFLLPVFQPLYIKSPLLRERIFLDIGPMPLTRQEIHKYLYETGISVKAVMPFHFERLYPNGIPSFDVKGFMDKADQAIFSNLKLIFCSD